MLVNFDRSVLSASILGAVMTGLMLSACGKARVNPPFSRNDHPNGTGAVTYSKGGEVDSCAYGAPALSGICRLGLDENGQPQKLGIVCRGEKESIEISFVNVLSGNKIGEPHLIVRGAHPGGPASKPSKLSQATFEARLNRNGKTDVFEKSSDPQRCTFEYAKEGHRGKGKFDCSGLVTKEEVVAAQSADDGLKRDTLNIAGEFDCYVFENE
jgi:hypothetical protein